MCSIIILYALSKLKAILMPAMIIFYDMDYSTMPCTIMRIGHVDNTIYLRMSNDRTVSIKGLYGHYVVSDVTNAESTEGLELAAVNPNIKLADYLNKLMTLDEDEYETAYYQLNFMLQKKADDI